MRATLYFLLLFPFLLFARVGDVLLSTQGTDPLPILGEVKEALAQKNIQLELTDFKKIKKWDKVANTVVWNKPRALKKKILYNMPKKRAVLFQWQSPVECSKLYARKYTRHFRRIYTWNDDLVDNYRYFKFYFPALKPMASNLPSFESKKLLTMVAPHKTSKKIGELYSARELAVQHFDGKSFEFYGTDWEENKYRSYRGNAPDLKNYRFTLCYEDMGGVKGYITEKIFDAFATGSVPIYLGATNVTDYIPKECFIDRRDFASDDELYAFIESMDKPTYENYLAHIRTYLSSDKAQLFSLKYFQVLFLEAIGFP